MIILTATYEVRNGDLTARIEHHDGTWTVRGDVSEGMRSLVFRTAGEAIGALVAVEWTTDFTELDIIA